MADTILGDLREWREEARQRGNFPKVAQFDLLIAIETNNIPEVKRLLETGTPADARDKYGRQALHYAAWGGSKEAAELLLEHGANPCTTDEIDYQPLHYAALWNNKGVAELLLAHGAQIDARDVGGATPLHKAIDGDNAEMVEFLLTMGASANALNDKGQTPLCLATDWRMWKSAKILKDHNNKPKPPEGIAEILRRQRQLGALRPRVPSL